MTYDSNVDKYQTRQSNDIKVALSRLESTLKVLQEQSKKQTQALADSLQNANRMRVEMELASRIANMGAKKALVAAEEQNVESEVQEQQGRADGIRERTERDREELEAERERRIRRVGAHIFELTDEAARLTDDATRDPLTAAVARTFGPAVEVFREKAGVVTDARDGVVENLDALAAARDEMAAAIADMKAEDVSPEKRLVGVPVVHVTSSCKGDASHAVHVPSGLAAPVGERGAMHPREAYAHLLTLHDRSPDACGLAPQRESTLTIPEETLERLVREGRVHPWVVRSFRRAHSKRPIRLKEGAKRV